MRPSSTRTVKQKPADGTYGWFRDDMRVFPRQCPYCGRPNPKVVLRGSCLCRECLLRIEGGLWNGAWDGMVLSKEQRDQLREFETQHARAWKYSFWTLREERLNIVLNAKAAVYWRLQ